jgi:hypothetical protein
MQKPENSWRVLEMLRNLYGLTHSSNNFWLFPRNMCIFPTHCKFYQFSEIFPALWIYFKSYSKGFIIPQKQY